ncbi:Dienelactone hydrolase family protein [Tsuneonella dongtanensis]|uniref:Dienelactone hydrolase family protein n=1 Tax=Tsuneonella dongtanensis TaxID=692370 RepID=A0A1B2AAX0_9SPHN|nr:dienelactone hydrolase family protein [Tsuneonella dongtanensis]ANY19310.1 Dienelactone hydrolase family protein [Tsuneonella dongtanensis]
MCDEADLAAFEKKGLARREFAAVGALVGLAACTSMSGDEGSAGLTESAVAVKTPDGTMDGFFVHPAKAAPGVILWPDIAGLREAKRAMARRLAASGYAVLVPNPYYRDVVGEQFADFATFAAQKGFEKVGPWRAKATDPQAIARDATALAAWLDSQRAVDRKRGIGNQGYCMGGPYTIHAAASVPSRIKAAASFHGGGLVTDAPTSPHKRLQSGARYLIAIARNDDAKQPAAKTILRETADAQEVSAEIEVYAADHGWCVPDSPAYNAAEADRAWGRLLALYAQL